MFTLTRPATTDEVNGVHDPAYTYELVSGKGMVARIPDEIPTEGERLGAIDLDLVAHIMRTTYNVEAYPGQMGGNCGAIEYGGNVKVVEDGHEFEVPMFLAGPGTYRTHLGHSTSTLHEFGTSMDTYAADTDDVGSVDAANVGAFTHSRLATLLVTMALHGNKDGLTADQLETAGFDGTLRSRPKWLTDDEADIAERIRIANAANRARHEQAAAARSYIPEGY